MVDQQRASDRKDPPSKMLSVELLDVLMSLAPYRLRDIVRILSIQSSHQESQYRPSMLLIMRGQIPRQFGAGLCDLIGFGCRAHKVKLPPSRPSLKPPRNVQKLDEPTRSLFPTCVFNPQTRGKRSSVEFLPEKTFQNSGRFPFQLRFPGQKAN